MKSFEEKMKQRSRRDRAMTEVQIRLPEDVIEDLNEVAPVFGFSGHHALIRAYVSDGLRRHEAMLEEPEVVLLRDSLKRHGIADDVISEVVADTLRQSA